MTFTRPPAKTKQLALPVGGPTSLPALTGLDALAEVSRQHGHLDYHTHQSSLANEFLNTDQDDESEDTVFPQTTGSQGQPPWPEASASASLLPSHAQAEEYASGGAVQTPQPPQMAEAALTAMDPQLPTAASANYPREPGQETLRDVLIEYSHGQPPSLDNHRVQHTPLQQGRDSPPSAPSPLIEAPSSQTEKRSALASRTDLKLIVGYVTSQPSIEQVESSPTMPEASPDPDKGATPSNSPMKGAYITKDFTGHYSAYEDANSFHQWYPNGASIILPKKVRGAFAPERRSAVKEVRKKGACLRCRMLKKSCDSGDPCKECAKLENARMWKGQCLRTRLGKMFDIFGSSLFMVVEHHAIEAEKSRGVPEAMQGRLEVSYFPRSGVFMTFPYVRSATGPGPNQLFIDIEDESIRDKLRFEINQYGSRLLELHHESGGKSLPDSEFLHETLKIAYAMSSRMLIDHSLQLWICVTIMSSTPEQLLILQEPRLAPIFTVVDIAPSDARQKQRVYSRLVYLQLRRTVERCADYHFKTVMVELEKSLIQRKQADNFETLIATIVLLRCLEQVCYLYRGLDAVVEPQKPSQDGIPIENVLPEAKKWPLDNPPSYYWQQGERFSDLLCSMLKLRKVTPQFYIKDGVLTAKEHEPRDAVRQWFNAVQLKSSTLAEARDKSFDVADETAWEFRWIAKIFEI